MPSRCHQRSTYGAVGTMRRRWMRPAISIPAATSATRRTTPERTARSRTACCGTGVKTTTPTSTPTSMIPLRICSVTSVPTSVVTGTDWPRAVILRRSTVTRATSPRRAMSTVFRRKPMKIGGTTSRTGTSSGRPSSSAGTASMAAFHVSAFAATDPRFAMSAAST